MKEQIEFIADEILCYVSLVNEQIKLFETGHDNEAIDMAYEIGHCVDSLVKAGMTYEQIDRFAAFASASGLVEVNES